MSEASSVSKSEATRSKLAVVALVAAILVGVGIWVWLESQVPIMDKDTAMRFAADFEKECQSQLDEPTCKKLMGEYHSECLVKSASRAEDRSVAYDQEIYRRCLRSKLPTS